MHHFTPRFADELELQVGERVEVLQSPDGGWSEGSLLSLLLLLLLLLIFSWLLFSQVISLGRIDSRTGWFPNSHTQPMVTPKVRQIFIVSL
jgi:hypothetical protein